MEALHRLTGDARTFVEKVWARRVGRYDRDPDDLVGLLSLDDVDHLITSAALRTPQFRLAQDGSVLPASRYTRTGATIAGQALTGLIDPRRTLELFEGGATVVLQGLHRYWPPLTALVGALEDELGHPCQANAYLTPPGSQGFAVHSDTHDVIVFQTHGSKQWEIHTEETVGEPLPDSEGTGAQQVRFTPGVVMYLPTGTPHAARAEDGVSLHVTVGITQLTWRQAVRRQVTRLLDEIDDTHLPAGYAGEPRLLADGFAERLRTLGERLAALAPDELARDQARQFLTHRNPRLRGALLDGIAVGALDADTPLRRRPGSRCVLDPRGDRLLLWLGDRELDVPGRLRPAIEQLLAIDGAFRPADLDLAESDALVLCRRLVREGLLTVVA